MTEAPSPQAAEAEPRALPIVPFLELPEGGDPHLVGQRCAACGQTILGTRAACAKCGAREGLEAVRLSDRGTLYVYSIVHRSFPGVEVPFVSAIVDLEGGGSVKGTLRDVDPDPATLESGLPVEVVYGLAPRRDKQGNAYMMFWFRPREGSA